MVRRGCIYFCKTKWLEVSETITFLHFKAELQVQGFLITPSAPLFKSYSFLIIHCSAIKANRNIEDGVWEQLKKILINNQRADVSGAAHTIFSCTFGLGAKERKNKCVKAN